MADLILASASPRRLELLAQIGITPISVWPADVDETALKDEEPQHYVVRMASLKAAAAHQQFPENYVLAADTIVACGRRILGKPQNEADAKRMLTLLSGRRHRVYTAVEIYAPNGQHTKRLSLTIVQFKRLSERDLQNYLASHEWQGAAGAYKIQGLAEAFVMRINGSYSGVVGLPLYETKQMLNGLGYLLPPN